MTCSMSGFPVLHCLLVFAHTHVHWVGDATQPSLPLLPHSPPAFHLSQHQFFSSESGLYSSWPKCWSFSFSISISLSNEYSGLISFRIDWFDLLAIQGTLKSLLQHHSWKASILQQKWTKEALWWASSCCMTVEGSRAEPELIIQRSPVWVRTGSNLKRWKNLGSWERSPNEKYGQKRDSIFLA